MTILFIEFKITNCERNVVVNVDKIMNFFEMKDGGCTIVMSSEEVFVVDHKYNEVINMISEYVNVQVLMLG
jgi:uncharacterized protein YlzI (FlbEa/FlbD family)